MNTISLVANILDRIEEACHTDCSSLNLSGLNLKVIPPEIGNLKNLEILDLSRNLLTEVDPIDWTVFPVR